MASAGPAWRPGCPAQWAGRSAGRGGRVSAGPESRPIGRARREREAAPRRVYQQVKLTPDEQHELRSKAGELGVSVPRLLVEAALGGGSETATERRREIAELFEVRRLLATVANNVNQLARTANTTGELPMAGRLVETLAQVEGLVVRLRRVTGVRR